MTTNFDHLQVRVNVTWQSTLLELSETSALVRVPAAPPTDRQTTVVIKNEDGESIYLPGRIVLSIPQTWGVDGPIRSTTSSSSSSDCPRRRRPRFSTSSPAIPRSIADAASPRKR